MGEDVLRLAAQQALQALRPWEAMTTRSHLCLRAAERIASATRSERTVTALALTPAFRRPAHFVGQRLALVAHCFSTRATSLGETEIPPSK